MNNLTLQDKQYLHRFLMRRFNLSEMKTLAFYLGYPFEDYPHNTTSDFAREILQYYERENALGMLLKQMMEERPDDQLTQIYAKLSPATPRVKVELVIRNAVTENAEDIRQRIARAMGWRPEDVGIIRAVPGSLKLLLSVPADKAPDLISLADDPQSWLPYEVASIQLYEQLPPAEQTRWRRGVMEQARPIIPATGGGLTGLALGKWVVILLIVTAVAVVVGGYLLAPRLEVLNACDRPLEIPPEVPVLGGQGIAPGAVVSGPILTGRYRYIYNGEGVAIEAQGQRFFWPVGSFNARVNDQSLRPNKPQTLDVGWGDRIFIEILRCQ